MVRKYGMLVLRYRPLKVPIVRFIKNLFLIQVDSHVIPASIYHVVIHAVVFVHVLFNFLCGCCAEDRTNTMLDRLYSLRKAAY